MVVQIHCGSRGLGHQVCTDYVQSFQAAVERYRIRLPDRELVCAPIDSPEGQAYFGASWASKPPKMKTDGSAVPGAYGTVQARDPVSGKMKWRVEFN